MIALSFVWGLNWLLPSTLTITSPFPSSSLILSAGILLILSAKELYAPWLLKKLDGSICSVYKSGFKISETRLGSRSQTVVSSTSFLIEYL